MSAGHGPRDDRAHWEARYAEPREDAERPASPWVVHRCLSLPADFAIVDLAGGSGRHAVPLARAGRTVIVVDVVARAVQMARRRDPRILGVVADVRALPVREASVDAIVCVSFLDRSLFASLALVLRPGGVLVYETFMRQHVDLIQAGRSRGPSSPAFLLDEGELRALVAPLVIREYAEGLVEDDAGVRHVARVVAVKA